MADPERGRSPVGYRERRIGEIVSLTSTREWRREHLTLFVGGDYETRRRNSLSVLPFSTIRFDAEGRIYIPRWVPTDHIETGVIIFGPTQKGRDYATNPPKTKALRQLHFDYVPAGIDVALRRTEKIRDKYRLENSQQHAMTGDNRETRQALAGLELISQLRKKTMHISQITELDLINFARESAEYITSYGLARARLADKIRIREMLLRGITDKNGRVNPLAVFARTFSMEVNWRRRLENALPNIFTKYTNNSEVLRFERDKTRLVLDLAIDDLSEIAASPELNDQDISQKGEEERYQIAKNIYLELSLVSERLIKEVKVRPYLLGAYVAVIQLGTHHLPEGSMRKIQERKIAQGVLSVRDLLRQGDFDSARDKLVFITHFLQRILDIHADYQAVKPSVKRRKNKKP